MKRLMVVAALMAAACASPSTSPESSPTAAPGYVKLGTFSGEVDTVAGTVRIWNRAPGGVNGTEVPGPITPGDSTLTIANSGSSWNDSARGAQQCGNALVTGANVQITSHYASGFAGGVYAQIDSVSATGKTACNGIATAPTGLDATKGLWSYGSIEAGGSSTVEWNFLTASSATRYTFQGSIWGVPGMTASAVTPASARQNLAYNGLARGDPSMVFIDSTGTRMRFTDLAGTSLGTSARTTNAAISAIAADTANGRIWYLTGPYGSPSNNEFGVAGANNGVTLAFSGHTADYGSLYNIVVDPVTPTRAWFAGSNDQVVSVDFVSGAPGTMTVGTVAISVGAPASNTTYSAFGSDGRLYAVTWGSGVYAVAVNGDHAVSNYPQDAVAGCTGLVNIVKDPRPGKNVVVVSQGNGKVCEMDTSGNYTVIGTGYGSAQGVAVTQDQGVWVSSTVGSGMSLVTGNTAYPIPLPGTTSFNSTGVDISPAVGATPAYVWAANSQGLFRITP